MLRFLYALEMHELRNDDRRYSNLTLTSPNLKRIPDHLSFRLKSALLPNSPRFPDLTHHLKTFLVRKVGGVGASRK
jgi:hypothetical protein